MANIAKPAWAIEKLDRFIALTGDTYKPPHATVRSLTHVGEEEEIVDAFAPVEAILDRLDPKWRDSLELSMDPKRRWAGHRRLALKAKADITNAEEIREMLGDNSPRISASSLHPWVWDSAKSLWIDGHFREAVNTAAIKVNAEAQRKTGVKNRSEGDLFVQLFKLDAAKAGNPRLRLMNDDGSKTYISLHEGAGSFARGCYMAIRNPSSHVDDLPDLTEHEALEQLAAFSQLARWVDTARLESAE